MRITLRSERARTWIWSRFHARTMISPDDTDSDTVPRLSNAKVVSILLS